MEIDIYQTCPCHSDKKIKFCCGKAIVGDLNRIVELNKSRQAVAALEHVERSISRLGPRDCLLTLKTHILLNLKEFDTAAEVNRQFLERNPASPIGFQHRALLLASQGQTLEAVEALQDAMDLLPGHEVPVSLASAFRIVGMLLISDGHLVAGREHLIFSSKLFEEEAIGPMIAQTWRAADIPLPVKRNFQLMPLDGETEHPWSAAWENARRFAEQGRWRAACQRLQRLDEQYPGQAAILDALARVSLTLGQTGEAADAWRRLADLQELPFDDRAELQALVLTISEVPLSHSLDLMRVTFPLLDQEKLTESILGSPRMVQGSMLGVHYHEGGPPPVAAGMLLDRDEIRSLEPGAALPQEFPRVIAECLVYGKRTDQDGRVELFVVDDRRATATIEQFCEIMGNAIGPESAQVAIDQITELEHLLDSRWHLPRNLDNNQRREFLERQRERDYLETWPHMSLLPLAGKTPLEACQDDRTKSVIAAMVLLLEQGADASFWGTFDFDRLRDLLGLPRRQSIPRGEHNLLHMSPLMIQRLDFEKLDDDDLVTCFVVGSTTGNHRLLRKCLPELLARPQLDEEAPFEQVYVLLARITPDNETALELMQQARQHAATRQRNVGMVLVMELDLRLQRDMADGCQELLRTIETRYLQDPQVHYQLASVLQKYGLLSGEGRSGGGEAVAVEQPVAVGVDEESGLWTPDGGRPPAAGGTEPGPSKLWLPD